MFTFCRSAIWRTNLWNWTRYVNPQVKRKGGRNYSRLFYAVMHVMVPPHDLGLRNKRRRWSGINSQALGCGYCLFFFLTFNRDPSVNGASPFLRHVPVVEDEEIEEDEEERKRLNKAVARKCPSNISKPRPTLKKQKKKNKKRKTSTS